MSTLAHENDGC